MAATVAAMSSSSAPINPSLILCGSVEGRAGGGAGLRGAVGDGGAVGGVRKAPGAHGQLEGRERQRQYDLGGDGPSAVEDDVRYCRHGDRE